MSKTTPPSALVLEGNPGLKHPRLVIGLDGWMDGGDVSTGTIAHLANAMEARKLGYIRPDDFYIFNIPGSMEVSALFRPHTRIEEGLIVKYDWPTNEFYYSETHNLILFSGKEPNLRWVEYVDCLLHVAETFGVETIYFIGSVAGMVPHTREPRLSASVSDASLKPELEKFGVRFSNYEGPASIITYLTREAHARGLRLISLVAEIPAYIQGLNPKCIESVIRRLSAMLGIEVQLNELRQVSDEFEAKVTKAISSRKDLPKLINKLEEDYDSEIFNSQMGDLKDWLEEKGISLE